MKWALLEGREREVGVNHMCKTGVEGHWVPVGRGVGFTLDF